MQSPSLIAEGHMHTHEFSTWYPNVWCLYHGCPLVLWHATPLAWHPWCPYGTIFMPDHVLAIFGDQTRSPGIHREFSI